MLPDRISMWPAKCAPSPTSPMENMLYAFFCIRLIYDELLILIRFFLDEFMMNLQIILASSIFYMSCSADSIDEISG